MLVVATPLFYWKWSLYPYAVPKTALFEALVEFIFALWIVLAVSDRRYRPRMTVLAWAVAAYLCVLTLTAFMGVDSWRSFFSDLERGFGIAAYIHLAVLALVVSSLVREIPWKKLWYLSFGTSLVTVVIAAIQLRAPDLLLANDFSGGRPGATFGNPTFLAGYLLFNIFLAGYFLLGQESGTKKYGEKVFLWATVIFGAIGVFITETRGDIFGLFAGIFVLIVLFALHPPGNTSRTGIFSRRSFYVLLVAILIIVAAGVWFTRGSAIWNNVPGIDRLKDITLTGANSDIGARVIAASAAWQGFLARPFTGWGFENFNVVFNTYYNPKILEYGYAESNFDKPHDIVLEMLDAGGVLLLVAYLGVLTALIYEAWKLRGRPHNLIGQFVTAIVIAYFVRSLVIFDTIGPVLMLYLLIGWIDGEYRRQEGQQISGGSRVNNTALGAALIVVAIVAYALNGTALAAGYFAWEGHEDIQLASQPAAGIANFEADAGTWNVYQWDFVRDYANTVAQAYFYAPSNFSTSSIAQAVAAMNQVAIDHPNDAYNHYLLTDIYNLTNTVDPQNYEAQAEAQANIALQLSPNRQEIYYYLTKTKTLEGDYAGALAFAKKALDLDPNVADSHFYYGMVAFGSGDNTTGYNEVETAIKMGRMWTNYYEPEVAANYFADSGHFSDAIQLYLAALALKPSDIDTEMRLGAAYYLAGDDASAKRYLSDAVSQFDVAASPAYTEYRPILQALGIPP
jgi:tetratricopeptide (TPR) repeat protein/O-antigen ligase